MHWVGSRIVRSLHGVSSADLFEERLERKARYERDDNRDEKLGPVHGALLRPSYGVATAWLRPATRRSS